LHPKFILNLETANTCVWCFFHCLGFARLVILLFSISSTHYSCILYVQRITELQSTVTSTWWQFAFFSYTAYIIFNHVLQRLDRALRLFLRRHLWVTEMGFCTSKYIRCPGNSEGISQRSSLCFSVRKVTFLCLRHQ